MAPMPVINGVRRITLLWSSSNGVTPRTVLHVESATATDLQVRDALAASFNAGIGMFECMSTLFTCSEYEMLPLDGTSGTTPYTLSTPLQGGGGSGDFIPAAAGVMSFRTAHRGSQGRGRAFIGPVPEGFQAFGQLDATKRSDMVGSWQAFQSTLQASSTQVAHVIASYKHSTFHTVNAYSIRPQLGTLRRRQNQLV